MTTEQKEKRILYISFISGLLFAIAEFIFAILSHSKSSLMDAAYDACELIFIILILFLTPLFHKPVSEKRPYGFFQIESIFFIIKGFMMLSVTAGVSATIVESALNGGNDVNGLQVSLFQLALGLVSVAVFIVMKKLSKSLTSPTIQAEMLGWKIDIFYSLGMSGAFLISLLLAKTPLAFIVPYFDPLIAVLVIVFMLPEVAKMLWRSIKDLFLFSPDEETFNKIKDSCEEILQPNNFQTKFFDITKTGRHLWVAIYFTIDEESLSLKKLKDISEKVNLELEKDFQDCTCELILVP